MIDLGVTFPDKQQKSRKHNTIENELPNRHMCQLAYEKDKGSLGLRLCAQIVTAIFTGVFSSYWVQYQNKYQSLQLRIDFQNTIKAVNKNRIIYRLNKQTMLNPRTKCVIFKLDFNINGNL